LLLLLVFGAYVLLLSVRLEDEKQQNSDLKKPFFLDFLALK
jgi:hypothetical protein